MTMKRLTVRSRAFVGTAALCLVSVLRLQAQTTAPAAGPKPAESEEALVLSPFVVDASEDADGYAAKSTLAGTRVRTELRDVASAISVVTSQFLQDTGARKSEDLLVYTTNTEVGGVSGNFSGAGGGSTYSEAGSLLRPSNNTRVRGLDSADNTRDYFLTEVPWDGFNVGRVDLQRGPNSILFGVGSPAGIINTSLNGAAFKNSNKVENRVDKYGSFRNSADFNYVILKNELAVRLSLLDDNGKYQQKGAFNHDRRVYGAVRYAPKWFGEGSDTMIRANYEQGNVHADRPRSLPPIDGLTPWFTYGNKLLLNPNVDQSATHPQSRNALFNESFLGRQYGPLLAIHYDGVNGNASRAIQAEYATPGGRGSAGQLDSSINDIPFFRYFALNTNNAYQRASGRPGGSYYVNISMDDPTIFDFYNKLIDGPNKREWQSWDAGNVAASQTFFNGQLGFELAYDYQRYDDGQVGFLNGDQFVIGVDINTKLIGGGANPNVGRPFVSNSNQYNNNATFVDRDSIRFTANGELRTEDFLGKGMLSHILGKHVFTGLLAKDTKRQENRGWAQFASEPLYSELINQTGLNGIPNPSQITDSARQINFITYIGPDLRGLTSAHGINLHAVTGKQVPPSTVNARYFDSRWNAPASVGFGDPYTFLDANGVAQTSTQSENSANYVGWQYRTIRIMNADKGDLAQLYSDGTKSKNVIKSKGITWQGYMFDGLFVPVFGWRKDEVSNISSSAPKNAITSVASMNYLIDPAKDPANAAHGESKSWGGVLHMPKSWSDKLPLGTTASLFYNHSSNFKADAPRGDIWGAILPNPAGQTKDYGIVISTLNDKLSLKINWYNTALSNATLAGDNAGFSGSLYYIWAVPAWESTFAIADLQGIRGQNDGNQWYWNYPGDPTHTPDGADHKYDSAWQPGTPNFDNSPALVKEKAAIADFFANFPLPQAFFDAYGLAIDVSKFKSSDPTTAIVNAKNNLAIQPAYQGRLKSTGSGPVASVDTTSKGIEFELTAQPIKNWNITVNASKTNASRSAVSPTIVDFMTKYTAFLAGPAGDLVLWGTDPTYNTFRAYWKNNIVNPYNVLQNQAGSQAPELAPWRFNAISTYSFNQGNLKGAYVGGAYRWEGKRILGYQYKASIDSLDISKPWYGPSDSHVDMWVGYSRKLTKRVNWRGQVNIRNLGESTHLVPVSLQPDGTKGLSRISEGMTWQLTNTFEF